MHASGIYGEARLQWHDRYVMNLAGEEARWITVGNRELNEVGFSLMSCDGNGGGQEWVM